MVRHRHRDRRPEEGRGGGEAHRRRDPADDLRPRCGGDGPHRESRIARVSRSHRRADRKQGCAQADLSPRGRREAQRRTARGARARRSLQPGVAGGPPPPPTTLPPPPLHPPPPPPPPPTRPILP